MQTRTYAVAAALLTAGLLGGLAAFVLTRGASDRIAGCTPGQVAGEIGGPFELLSETGATVTDREIITKPTLLYFGYTFCPDVCPLDTVRNAETVDILKERGYDVQSAMISVDYGRDTPETMADFTANIHPEMIGLSGSEEQIRAASQAYRTYFNVRDPDDEFYLIDHSTFTYLVLPETGFVAFFRRELSGDQMADQVACILDAL